jgi:hypothetical protein
MEETTRKTWCDTIKMDLSEIGWGDVDSIDLALDRDQGFCEHGNEPSGFIKC